MRSYSLASTSALVAGWGIAMVCDGAISLWGGGELKSYDLKIVAFWSLLFMMIANGLFIQWPEKFISRLCCSKDQLTFLIASILYAIVAFVLLVGWLFFVFHLGIIFSGFWVLFYDAIIIGLVFGLCFPLLWKHDSV